MSAITYSPAFAREFTAVRPRRKIDLFPLFAIVLSFVLLGVSLLAASQPGETTTPSSSRRRRSECLCAPHPGKRARQRAGEKLDVRLRRRPAQAEPDRARRELRRHSHRGQHMRARRLCPTSRPSPTTPRRRRDRAASATSRPRFRERRKHVVLGSRGAPAPNTTASGAAAKTAPPAVAQRRQPDRLASSSARAARAAAPKPAMRGDVFGAGARAPLLPAAAQQGRAECRPPGARRNAPTPLGPPNLWAERIRKSAPSAASQRRRPASCTASQTTSPPRAWTSAAASATGCTTPVSLLAPCSASSAGGPRRARPPAPPDRSGRRRRSGAISPHPARSDGRKARRHVSAAPSDQPCRAPRLPDSRRQREIGGLGPARGEDDAARRDAGECRDGAPRVLDSARAARPSAWIEEGLPAASNAAASPLAPRGATARSRCNRDRRAHISDAMRTDVAARHARIMLFFLAIAGALRAMRPDPRPAISTDTSEPSAAPSRRKPALRTRGRLAQASAPGRRRTFWRRNARSFFQWPRRPPGRPISSRQAARRADRGRTASAPAVRRHDEQPDRLQHLLLLRRARLLGAALQFSRRRPLAGRLRSRPGRIVGRGLARSIGRSRSARRRAPAGSPASRSGPGSACSF